MPSHPAIERRAHELYQMDPRPKRSSVFYWLRAEAELREQEIRNWSAALGLCLAVFCIFFVYGKFNSGLDDDSDIVGRRGELYDFLGICALVGLSSILLIRYGSRYLAAMVSNENLQASQNTEGNQNYHLMQLAEALRDLHRWHAHIIGVIGVMITLTALLVAWEESKSTENQKRVEQNQTLFGINKSFEDVLDLPVRRRYYRLANLFETPGLDKKALVEDLDSKNVSSATENWLTNSASHTNLMNLIQPDLEIDYASCANPNEPGVRDAFIQTEISNYHAVLMKVLNVLDTVAFMKQSARDSHMNPGYIDEMFWFSVTNSGYVFRDFIVANQNGHTNVWQALVDATPGIHP